MHVLCDCETIKEFWKFVIELINVNINNNRYKYVENDVMLGCLNANLSMNEKQIVNFFILNATWIVLNKQSADKTMVSSVTKISKEILMCSRNKKIQTISTKLVL